MSVIPEVILHRVIVNGIRSIRKDPRILDVLFKNVDQDTLQKIRDFILKKSINFTINYPRTDFKTPTIALLLKNEAEAQTFLGDVMGAAPHYDMPDQDVTIDTLGGSTGASVSDLSGLPRKLIEGLTVEAITYDVANDLTTLFWPESQRTDIDDFLETIVHLSNMFMYVVGGTGAGKTYRIFDLDRNSLDIEGQFDPQLDSSSLVDIRAADTIGHADGEPSRVYTAGTTNLLRKGANFETQYQMSVLAGHQDEVLYLYSVLKGLLFSQKVYMEEQGIQALQISGSDFAPRTEYLPSEIFQRVMILRFIYPFSFLEELDTYDSIQLDLRPFCPESFGVTTINVDLDD